LKRLGFESTRSQFRVLEIESKEKRGYICP
jgi:hypothetical protein